MQIEIKSMVNAVCSKWYERSELIYQTFNQIRLFSVLLYMYCIHKIQLVRLFSKNVIQMVTVLKRCKRDGRSILFLGIKASFGKCYV